MNDHQSFAMSHPLSRANRSGDPLYFRPVRLLDGANVALSVNK